MHKLKQETGTQAGKFYTLRWDDTNSNSQLDNGDLKQTQTAGKVTTVDSRTELDVTKEHQVGAAPQNSGDTDLGQLEQQLQNALHNFKATQPCTPEPFDLKNLDAFKQTDEFRKAVLAAAGQATTEFKSGDQEQKNLIDSYIKTNFGDNNNKFKTKIWDHIEQNDYTNSISGTTLKGKIAALASTGTDLLAAGSRAGSNKCDRESSPTKGTKDSDTKETSKPGDKADNDKATAADCTATEADKCDKNKCTWDKEKNQCKVKEGAAVISAVIKAPLWLAVLLLL
uniref:Variant surface glycoprotein 1125.5576 n=1 Tax=Trypanosoma brucei TaxID=5691 RepID=A0A1J0RCN6_9TRYP|nr:variant surface glycoprotein 1125.5576 [Trypanosoma brucei]